MKYKIIVDSCTDLIEEMKNDDRIRVVPLSIEIGNTTIVDDETFDQNKLLKLIKTNNTIAKTSCPSPEAYMEEMKGDEDIFVVTLSANLSGSYNSAMLAKQLYIEEYGEKNIEVINSCSASVAQTLITMKLMELTKTDLSFTEIVDSINQFRDGLKTKFVLKDMDTLAKNGRLSRVQAILVSVLNIKPIMAGTDDGHICKLGQARGFKRALENMIKMIEEDVINAKEKILGIAHCNNFESAVELKNMILEKIKFKDFLIVDTAGISTTYANDGGIIVSY